MRLAQFALVCFIASIFVPTSSAAEWGMKEGNPGLKSAGSLAFGTNGVLFIGDTKSAAVVAIDTGDKAGEPDEVDLHEKGIDKKIAKALGAEKVMINDLAVNPLSGIAYVSASHGEDKAPAVVRIMPSGEVEPINLSKIAFSKVELPNAPEDKVVGQGRRKKNLRDESITDLAFSEGKVLVSGVVPGGPRGKSNVRELVFPFHEADKGVNVEIYHGMHGKYEDYAAVKTFIPFKINGEPHLLAGFQCTPLVKFPLKELKGAEKVRGTTVAELGNWNRPLDMIVYKQEDKDYLLVTNTARGVMKISTDEIEKADGITQKVKDTAGPSYETIEGLKNVEQMDRLNKAHALVLAKTEAGAYDLHTVELP